MISTILEFFTHSFVRRAFAAGIFISVCASLLGVVLVLKHYSLIGHGLADVGFASTSAALALGVSPLLISAPAVVAASFLIMAYSGKKKSGGDAALGIAATVSMAFGVIVTSLSNGFNADVYNYMFGSILAVGNLDAALSIALAAVVILLFALFYNRIFLLVSDEDFARASGLNVKAFGFLISFLTALAVIVGMKIMGTLLISSLVIIPAVTAGKIAKSFKMLAVTAAVISAVCFSLGIILSFALNLPAGASVVAVNAAVLGIVWIVGNKNN